MCELQVNQKILNMKNRFVLFTLGVFLSVLGYSQNEIDALRYSQRQYGGTARFSSMAGAFGALGGDFSALSINPASIGIYRRSEFTVTPSFFGKITSSLYDGNRLDDSKYNVNFNNVGAVLSYYNADSKSAWKGGMFGFGYNRLNNFHNRISMSGKNYSSSLLDIYRSDAIGSGLDTSSMDAFGTQLALNTNAVWIDSLGNVYHHLQGSYGEEQAKYVTTSGSIGETIFTFGGNYNDKLFLGATLGIPNIRYYEEASYSEKADSNALNGFKSFELNQVNNTTGTGFNFKFGMIYKPTDWVRIGGAIHSPTYFTMNDQWNSSMKTKFANSAYNGTANSPDGNYDYSLTTPLRAMGSLGFVINKIGLIGLDYEFVDYPSASLRSKKYKYLSENNAIRVKYVEGSNIRVGTEWRLQNISLRGGLAYYSNPFKSNTGNNGERMDYAAGIGFRDQNFFLDFAYVYSQNKDSYYFYDASIAMPSVNTSKSSSILVTLGIKL